MDDQEATEYATKLINFWRERGGSAKVVEVIVYSEKNRPSYASIVTQNCSDEKLYFKNEQEITKATLWAYVNSLDCRDQSQHTHIIIFRDGEIDMCFKWK